MKKILIFLVIVSATFILTSNLTFANQPQKEDLLIDQAIWSETTKDKVFNACLAALTMEGYAINPQSANKDSGLIVTKPRSVDYERNTNIQCYYTLQVVVTEIQHNKVMVNVNAVDKNYDWKGSDPGKTVMLGYFDKKTALDFKKFFAQLENLLGKAESYKKR